LPPSVFRPGRAAGRCLGHRHRDRRTGRH
jgi:hypothetical protein